MYEIDFNNITQLNENELLSIQPKGFHYEFTGRKTICNFIDRDSKSYPIDVYEIKAITDICVQNRDIAKDTIGGWISLDAKLFDKSWVDKNCIIVGAVALNKSLLKTNVRIISANYHNNHIIIQDCRFEGSIKIESWCKLLLDTNIFDSKYINITIKPNDYISKIEHCILNTSVTFQGKYLSLRECRFSGSVSMKQQVIIEETSISGRAVIINAKLYNVNIDNHTTQESFLIDLTNAKTYKNTTLSDEFSDIYDVVPYTANLIENAYFVKGEIFDVSDYFSIKCYWDKGRTLTYIKSCNEYVLNTMTSKQFNKNELLDKLKRRDITNATYTQFFYKKMIDFIEATQKFGIDNCNSIDGIKNYIDYTDENKHINTKLYNALIAMCVICGLLLFVIFGFVMKNDTVEEFPNKTFMEIPITDTVNVEDSIINDSILLSYLKNQKIKHPQIVLAQAKLESANYTSDLYKTNNNLFGMRIPSNRMCVGDKNSDNKYMQYESWKECVIDYGIYQLTYIDTSSEEAYYNWLGEKYAEDSLYTEKVKRIANSIK